MFRVDPAGLRDGKAAELGRQPCCRAPDAAVTRTGGQGGEEISGLCCRFVPLGGLPEKGGQEDGANRM